MIFLALLLAGHDGPTPGFCNAIADRLQYGPAVPKGPHHYDGIAADLMARYGKSVPSETDRAEVAGIWHERLEAFARMCLIPAGEKD
jgi:hypothetical protein